MISFRAPQWGMTTALATLGLVAGCGGGGGRVVSPTPIASAPAPTPTPVPAPTPAPAPTPTATPTSTFITAEFNRSTGPAQHGAITAWAGGTTGAGVTIGVVDSGIDSDSPEFAGRLSVASADVAGSRGIDNPDDDHGTNVSLIAAAARDNTGIVGIAFGATIAMFRADSPGSCATFDPAKKDSGCSFNDVAIAAGVNRAIDAGARVINLSLGGSPPSAALRAAVQRAAASGVVVVISAGNDGDSTDAAKDPNNPDPFAAGLQLVGNGNVIIVGSVDANNLISTFSNRAGTFANSYLTARGERVCCTYENGVLKVTTDSTGARFVTVFSGTSFSAPQVAGAVALLRQAFPNLSATQTVDLLLRTARDAGAAGIDATYGRGILDITAAFAPQGTTSLANSTAALPLGGSTLVTSSAMGDARGLEAQSAVVLDSYSRAYGYDLSAGFRHAQIAPRLASALDASSRNLSLGGGRLALAFSVDARGRTAALPWRGQLRLSGDDAQGARVLAARVIARIAPKTLLGFAMAQGPDGLVAQLQGQERAAFLIAGSPLDDLGFTQARQTSVAVRRELGSWGLTASAATGSALTGAPVAYNESLARGREENRTARYGVAFDRNFGAVGTAMGATWLREDRTVLGALLNPGLGGGRGAESLVVDAAASWRVGDAWRLGANLRGGATWPRAGGVLQGRGALLSSAWSLDATRFDLLARGDSMSFRLSQPLRVERGALGLLLPVDYDYATLGVTEAGRNVSLTPKGREIDAELAWRGALMGGTAGASLFYRRDPGHYAALPDDKGLAMTWSRAF